MNISVNAVSTIVVGSAGIVLVTLALGSLRELMRFRAPVPSLRDQLTTARYVMRYDNALEWRGVGMAGRRGLTDELRRNIADAAASDGIQGVLERLGHPRDLASAVAARDRGPRWVLGAVVALGLWFALQLAAVIGVDLLTTGVEQVAPPSASVEVETPLIPGATFAVTTDASGALDSMSVETGSLNLFVPFVAFVVFSSPWRLLAAMRTRGADGGAA